MSMSQPNLLLVFADQLRAAACGCYGNGFVRTPTLDAMAAGGVRMTRCFANSPVCGPMRATMWTGTHPTTHGVVANDLAVRTDLPSLGTVLRDAGYRTGYIGKWHLDGVPRRKFTPPGPRRLGFDDFWAAFNCAHDYFAPYYFRDRPDRIEPGGYEPAVQTDLACEFLDNSKDDDRPFALVVSYGPPHDPYPQVPAEYRAMYDPADVPLRANVQLHDENPLARGLDPRRTIADYYAATTALDTLLGQLLKRLERNGQAGDTLVVFGSDHGDMLWSHGLMKKQSPYTESVHVPLILRGPGLPVGRACEATFGLIDLAPTLLGLLGVDVPPTMQGLDLSPAVRGESGANSPDDVLLSNQFSSDEAADQNMPEWRGVRTRTHTYVETAPGVAWLLFDDAADPYQLTNLAGRPEVADLQRRLSGRLAELLAASDDPFVPGPELMARMGLEAAWRERNELIYA